MTNPIPQQWAHAVEHCRRLPMTGAASLEAHTILRVQDRLDALQARVDELEAWKDGVEQRGVVAR